MSGPQEKPDLFRATADTSWLARAVAGGEWGGLTAYQIGYREAGDVLVDAAVSSRMLDTLFYPVCSVYRHCLELTLKDLIYETERLIEAESLCNPREDIRDLAEVAEDLQRTHSLGCLYEQLKERLATVSEEEMPTNVSETVRQLDKIDPNGQSFRYAVLKDGQRSFEIEHEFDLIKIKELLGETIDFLNYGVGSWIGERMNCLSEMLANSNESY